jgi:hypothetical protein
MIAGLVEVAAAVLVTAAIMLAPGTALLSLLRAWPSMPPLLRPAGAVLATLVVAAPALAVTLALHTSLQLFGGIVAVATFVLTVLALLRWKPDRTRERPSWRTRLGSTLPFVLPGAIVSAVAAIDAPHVRSDTFWHVALMQRLLRVDELSSAAIAFEAGARSNANYPLPVWHALVALADFAPRVDAWSATWFLTIWLAPVVMLAFGGMASALVGVRGAGLVGAWTFAAIVVLGYGPWFFATRFLSYPGQVAIYVLLPLALTAVVLAISRDGYERAEQLVVAGLATAGIGILHGNYVLYPALFACGAAALLLLGKRDRKLAALGSAALIVLVGAATLAAQLPWITDDDNFLRGGAAPKGEPSAFTRHRDVFTGSADFFHVELGSLATQPWLVLGALAIPAILFYRRRRPGPWVLAGGSVAIVVIAALPWAVELLDRVGSVTPVTRLDRIYPAAVGVVGIALGIGWLLAQTRRQSRALGSAAIIATCAALAAGTWWADSIRDTRRIVVTPFVEARWVGGLEPAHLPRVAVVVATAAILAVALIIRLRSRVHKIGAAEDQPLERPTTLLAAMAMAAITIGLAPASVDRLHAAWQPQAYRASARDDHRFERIEVYPASTRGALEELEVGDVVLGGFNDVRRIASIVPVQSVEESELRAIVADPPAEGAPAKQRLDELVDEWHVDYVAASRYDRSFATMLDAAERDPARYEPIDAGPLRMFRVDRSD